MNAVEIFQNELSNWSMENQSNTVSEEIFQIDKFSVWLYLTHKEGQKDLCQYSIVPSSTTCSSLEQETRKKTIEAIQDVFPQKHVQCEERPDLETYKANLRHFTDHLSYGNHTFNACEYQVTLTVISIDPNPMLHAHISPFYQGSFGHGKNGARDFVLEEIQEILKSTFPKEYCFLSISTS
ncbi:MAG: hypothetical protein CMO81_03865 [Waddliaceae bacterium]|nr:hypothetical protein [Waddliaceae bacterium]